MSLLRYLFDAATEHWYTVDNRILHLGDFSGEPTPLKNNYAGEILYRIRYWMPQPNNPQRAKFICEISTRSWIDGANQEATLNHEQRHYDIGWICAHEAQKDVRHARSMRDLDDILRRTIREDRSLQKRYDKEIYADRSRQEVWDRWVIDTLRKYGHPAAAIRTQTANQIRTQEVRTQTPPQIHTQPQPTGYEIPVLGAQNEQGLVLDETSICAPWYHQKKRANRAFYDHLKTIQDLEEKTRLLRQHLDEEEIWYQGIRAQIEADEQRIDESIKERLRQERERMR